MKVSRKFITWMVDARTLLFLSNFALVVIGMLFLKMQRTWLQIGFGLSMALLAEFLWLYFYKKQRKFEYYHLSSSVVTGIGLILVLNLTEWWLYGLLSVVGTSSKYLLKKNERDHLFNPSNFAIVALVALSSSDTIRIYSDQFAMSKYVFYHVLIFGLICCFLVDRLALIFSYMGTFAAFAILFDRLNLKMNFYDIIGSELGAGALIFLFFMITDPRTSPKRRSAQVMWGIFVATLSVAMKYQEVYYSRFLALFIATAVGIIFESSARSTGLLAKRQELIKAAS